MDLRKSVLTKQKNVLSDSFGNVSTLTAYESAVDESDNSLYFSFSNESSIKSECDNSSLKDVSDVNSSMMSNEDKENTVIMRYAQDSHVNSKQTGIREPIETENVEIPASDGALFKMRYANQEAIIQTESNEEQEVLNLEVTSSLIDVQGSSVTMSTELSHESGHKTEAEVETTIIEDNSAVAETVTPEVEDPVEPMFIEEVSMIVNATSDQTFPISHEASQLQHNRETETLVDANSDAFRDPLPQSQIEIIIQDPNENIVNPFTKPIPAPRKMVTMSSSIVVEKRTTRRTTLYSKVPPTNPFYSPVLRQSLERKSKIITKPATSRRTLHPTAIVPSTSAASSVVKNSAQIPKPMPMTKPKANKCRSTGCTMEFPTLRALQEHQKTHKTSTAHPTFICKWCDKKFQLEVALFNHHTEKCSEIPVNEKRKILAQRDKREGDRRRTTLFRPPVSTRKSPRRNAGNGGGTLNKSGIMITPKRSLKCHVCKMIIADAIGLANHILSHKYNRENKAT